MVSQSREKEIGWMILEKKGVFGRFCFVLPGRWSGARHGVEALGRRAIGVVSAVLSFFVIFDRLRCTEFSLVLLSDRSYECKNVSTPIERDFTRKTRLALFPLSKKSHVLRNRRYPLLLSRATLDTPFRPSQQTLNLLSPRANNLKWFNITPSIRARRV